MDPGASPLPLGIGRYTLFEEIASGGMATVHLGRLLGGAGFSRTVAIKRMRPECAKEPDFVAMFVDEARLAARVQHPSVVPILDVVATRGELFLVMEYVMGESLARLQSAAVTRGERIPPRVACAIMMGVLSGLHAAHEAKSERGEALGMVHRDVSAQNVIVGVDGIARVLDFGIAKAVGRIGTTRGGQVKGKLAYMSPEQLRGAAVNRTTDVYAAGVVLWETLTGSRLFAGATDSETLNNVLAARVRSPSETASGLPRALDAIVLRALERDQDSRFQTAREMALALERSIEPAPPSEVGELVERLAERALADRAKLVAEVESRSPGRLQPVEVLDAAERESLGRGGPPAKGLAAGDPAARPPRAARGSPGRVAAMLLLGSAILAALLIAVASWRSPVVSVARATAESPVSPPSPVSSTSASSAVSSPLVSAPSSRSARPRRSVSPGPKSQCEPPWYLDPAGVKKWKPECR